MYKNFFLILRHLVLGIILPTADTFSDINFAISAFSTQNPRIGISMLLPVILNLAFNIYFWMVTKFDSETERRFTWLLIIMNVWPQYQVLKLIVSIVRGKDNWKNRQEKIRRDLSYIEPFIEAVPQYFIALGVFGMLVSRDAWEQYGMKIAEIGILNIVFQDSTSIWQRKEDNKITEVFGKDTLGISNTIMFPLSLAVSFITSIRSVTDYLQNGPIKISSENKLCNIFILIAKVIYVSIEFINMIFFCIVFSNIPTDGAWIYLIVLTIHMMIPLLWVILPITRYLGIKKSAILFLGSPQLLMLPFITDFVFGPLNGYRRCNCCGSKCCCSIGCCFCWCCCCQICRYEEGHEIIISKEMSTIKMIYSFCILLLFCIMTYFGHFGEGSAFHKLLITYFVLAGIGKICFVTILYAGKNFHVLKIDNS